MIICQACGHPNPETARFCAQCGAGLGVTPRPEAETMLGGTAIGGPGGTPAADAPTMAGGSLPTGAPGTAPTRIGPPTAADVTVLGSTPTGGTSASAGPLAPGQAFGPRYHIIKVLGVGGMGAVYQAWDAELNVAVALKVIRPEVFADPVAAREIERRFKRELLLARQVTHKNVVRIHDLGELDGIKYITMTYVEGADLSQILKKDGRLPVARVLAIAKQVAPGLQAAHESGIVHRDLKPANIMIEDDRALIMDFGIARTVGPSGGESAAGGVDAGRLEAGAAMATQVGSVIGTVEYMAPEQARAEAVDQRADIYAFGLIVYDLLLGGNRAAAAANPVAELMQRMKDGLPAPRSIDANIPEELDRIVRRCIDPDPAARFQTTADLVADLDRLGPDGQLTRQARIRRRAVPIAAAAVTLVVALAAGTWWIGRWSAPVVPEQLEPVSVLIADFENRTNDPVFDGSLEPVLGLGVEGAAFITSYSRRDAQRLVDQLSPGRRLDQESARLVAASAGVEVILAGAIEPIGPGYRIEITAIDPAAPEPLAVVRGAARDRGAVLETIQDLASEIRTELGDTTPESVREQARETFTAASLDAARAYSTAQDLAGAGKYEEAIALYREAVGHDESFGRAYAGWAVGAYRLGRRDEAEQLWKKAFGLMDRMTERERYRTLGGYYLGIANNYEQAIENYEALVERYPSDGAGLNSLAVAYFETLDFQKALEQGRRALAIYPRNGTYRTNLALYAMYAGDFDTARKESAAVAEASPSLHKAYLPLAIAGLEGSAPDEARVAYERMAAAGTAGASLAATGLADLAMYQGRFDDAEAILTQGLAADQAARLARPAAVKQVALAGVFAATGRPSAAVDAARTALQMARPDEAAVIVPAAHHLLRGGFEAEARTLADGLSQRLQPRSRAYAKLIEADLALESGRPVEASDALLAARALADLWLVRFALARTYVEAGHYAEAIGELRECLTRRGEAAAVFLDDVPTYRYLVPVSYWMGRAQEGLGLTAEARASYAAYLALRGGVAGDALAADARQRLGL